MNSGESLTEKENQWKKISKEKKSNVSESLAEAFAEEGG